MGAKHAKLRFRCSGHWKERNMRETSYGLGAALFVVLAAASCNQAPPIGDGTDTVRGTVSEMLDAGSASEVAADATVKSNNK